MSSKTFKSGVGVLVSGTVSFIIGRILGTIEPMIVSSFLSMNIIDIIAIALIAIGIALVIFGIFHKKKKGDQSLDIGKSSDSGNNPVIYIEDSEDTSIEDVKTNRPDTVVMNKRSKRTTINDIEADTVSTEESGRKDQTD